ncbi:hypothetical protein OUZ56_010593 [Daphnia magna]|uniref:Uncharacterized protein n=1 Tax=Daphnia magna TaxID=35525 RepID=A0ABR0AJ62_9CRUS|nr:hypothetical protein OUZ56_010593 [Daphnia magna]
MSRHDWKYNADSSCYMLGHTLITSTKSLLYQKRLKKERRARRKLADQLELETKRRCQFEEALKTTSSETFLVISEKLNQEIDQERKGQQQQPSSQTTENNETDNTIENRGVYYKNSLLFTNAS